MLQRLELSKREFNNELCVVGAFNGRLIGISGRWVTSEFFTRIHVYSGAQRESVMIYELFILLSLCCGRRNVRSNCFFAI